VPHAQAGLAAPSVEPRPRDGSAPGTHYRERTIGGPLGSRSGLLVGSLFYDKLPSSPTPSQVNSTKNVQAYYSRPRPRQPAATVVQIAIDVIAASPEAIAKFLPFVAENCPLPI